MSTSAQIPRSSIIWMLLTQFAVMLSHLPRLSWWMIAIWLLCATWRMAMFRGQASYPGLGIRLLLVVLGCGGIAIEFGSLGSLDIAVALLMLAFSLKVIEVKERRDLFIVLFLAYFIVAAAFLFSQSLFFAVYQLACVVFITAALVAMQQTQHDQSSIRSLKTSLKLVAQAIPIMLVFFLVFPRLGPLWAVPDSKGNSSTGMSDNMSPGDIAELSRSPEVAFRVVFEGAIPEREQLYWRATTLSYFDGRTWTANPILQGAAGKQQRQNEKRKGWHTQAQAAATEITLLGKPVRYEINMEPNEQHWVFALPIAAISEDTNRVTSRRKLIATNDLSIKSKDPFYTRSLLSLESYLSYRAEPTMTDRRQRQETALPAKSNPRTRQVAENWYREAGSPEAYINKVLWWFREQDYYYTLKPPKLGRYSIDEFLFDTKMGVCEHYSSAFTFMMRAAGIPARVVIGYQGGEENPFNQSLIIRQYDAHAWAEVWLEGSGWQRFDPTGAVAPERVLYGLEEALSDRSEFMTDSLFSPLRYRNIAWLNGARLRLDALNYNWHKWVINFDSQRQLNVLQALLGNVTPIRMALVMMVTLCSILGLVAISLLRHRVSASVPAETRLYWLFCQRLERLGLERAPGEAPGDYALRVIQQYPHLDSAVSKITGHYQAILYAGDASLQTMKDYRAAVRHFRPKSVAR